MVITLKKDPAPGTSPGDGSIIRTDEWNKLVDTLTAAISDKILANAIEGLKKIIVKKVTEIRINSTGLSNDDELFVALEANKIYSGVLYLMIDSNPTVDMKINFTVPAGATGLKASGTWGSGAPSTTLDIDVQDLYQTSGGDQFVPIFFTVIMGGTPGNLQLQYAQNASDINPLRVFSGSTLTVWEQLP